MAKSGKLVDNLAESLVDALGESKDLDLMNNEKFSAFTDLLHEVSNKIEEKGKELEKRNSEKLESETQLLYDTLIVAVDSVYNGAVGPGNHLDRSLMEKDIHKGAKAKNENKDESKKKSSFKDDVFKKNLNKNEKTDQQRILELLEKMSKATTDAIKESDKKSEKRAINMTRSIKKTIKSRMGKLWSMFKKVLIVGLLLFFAPILKDAFTKMKDAVATGFNKFKDFTEPLWRPFIEWFQKEFPKVTDYMMEIADYVKKIGISIKKIADGISGLIDWKDEHPTLTAGISAGLAGAGLGAVGGPIGMLIGGVGGFLLGAGAQTIYEAFKNPNPTNSAGRPATAAEIAEAQGITEEEVVADQNKFEGQTDYRLKKSDEHIAQANAEVKAWQDLTPQERIEWLNNVSKIMQSTKVTTSAAEANNGGSNIDNIDNIDVEGVNHTPVVPNFLDDKDKFDAGVQPSETQAYQSISTNNQTIVYQQILQNVEKPYK